MFAFKNAKLIVLALFLVASIYLLVNPFAGKRYGVVVTEVNPNSSCTNVEIGNLITQISGTEIKNVNDFNGFVGNVKGGNYVNMVVGGGPANCVALKDGDLGIRVKDIGSESLRLGTDIAGSSIFSFEPSEGISENVLNEIVKIIEKRIKFFDLPQTKVYKDGSLIKIESFKDVDLNRLIMVGRIDTKIIQDIRLENETGKIKVGSESFAIKVNEKINVNGVNYSIEEPFKINNITFILLNSTKDNAVISVDVYSNNDIDNSQAQFGSVEKISAGVFQFTVPIQLSKDASNRFSLITRGMGVSQQLGSAATLNGKIVFYLDGRLLSQPLDIPIEFAGKDIGVVVGFGKTTADADKQMKTVQAALSFGQLPKGLSLVKEDELKPRIGISYFEVLFSMLLISFLAFIFVEQIRYKKARLGIYVTFLSLAELICIIGVVVFFQKFSSYSITIDFPMFIGLVVFAWFSMTKMLISTEEYVKKSRLDVVYKYKKIISMKNVLNLSLIAISLLSFLVGYGGFGYAMLTGFLIDVLLINLVYKDLLKKSAS